jgi:LPXTG-motif cell wall-anchored protein
LVVTGAVALILGVGSAWAQQPVDMRTYFTFSGPVALPGVTLPAGKYLFRLADASNRDVVQVLSADGRTPYAMFFIHRVNRPEAPARPEVRFMETAAGMPSAVRTWWYPGERNGYELVYPREQARLLAKGTGEPVLAAAAEVKPTPQAAPPALARVQPSGEETPVAQAAPAAPTGRIQEGEVAPAEPVQVARASLPKTASRTPVVGLAGLMLLLSAGLIRGWRFARQS